MAWCVGKESGINKASRELCIGKDEAHHATKIASRAMKKRANVAIAWSKIE